MIGHVRDVLSTYGSDAITPIVLQPNMVYANLWALRHSYSFRSVRYNAATPSPVMFVVQGINFAAFEQPWSIIVSMALKPFDSGRSVIRSMATIWKGPEWGSGVIGCNGAFWWVVRGLFSWQTAHLCYNCASWTIIFLSTYSLPSLPLTALQTLPLRSL